MADSTVIIKLIDNGNGDCSCQVPVSKEKWLEILSDSNLVRPELKNVLLAFYFMPGHKASCSRCAERYGYEVNWYNSGVSSLGKAVVNTLRTFKIFDAEGKKRFWPTSVP